MTDAGKLYFDPLLERRIGLIMRLRKKMAKGFLRWVPRYLIRAAANLVENADRSSCIARPATEFDIYDRHSMGADCFRATYMCAKAS
jgi:hypothetical protein